MTCLEEFAEAPRVDQHAREKADKAFQLRGQILNVSFLLTLSGLGDIYQQYGKIVNVAQMVRLLPHERYDLFMKAVNEYEPMLSCLDDHSKCNILLPNEDDSCYWPLYHADQKTLRESQMIRGIKVPYLLQDFKLKL